MLLRGLLLFLVCRVSEMLDIKETAKENYACSCMVTSMLFSIYSYYLSIRKLFKVCLKTEERDKFFYFQN